MTKEEFKNAFNMGRSYSGMPYGFNDSVNWKYKDAEEAIKVVKNLTIPDVVQQSEQFICKVCGKPHDNYTDLYNHYDDEHNK